MEGAGGNAWCFFLSSQNSRVSHTRCSFPDDEHAAFSLVHLSPCRTTVDERRGGEPPSHSPCCPTGNPSLGRTSSDERKSPEACREAREQRRGRNERKCVHEGKEKQENGSLCFVRKRDEMFPDKTKRVRKNFRCSLRAPINTRERGRKMLAGRDRLAFASLPPAGEPSSLSEREPHRGGALRSEQPACLLSRSLQRWPPRSKRVVIVDDSLTVRRIVEVSLRRVGFAMFSCEHGLVFVRWLATVACLPDVLLLDVMVPRLDRSALARSLKARPASQHLPSIFRHWMLPRPCPEREKEQR